MARKYKRKVRKSKKKTIFKSKTHKNIQVDYDVSTNTYTVYFVSDCKKPKKDYTRSTSADLHEDAKLVLMSCPEYPCGSKGGP